ncbi:myb-related transcription factor, partner of profilin-like [Haliotis rubra]|uniref:myb-related transcription factor, partner of profilin-like n=1 Tax=Haliotis rubra TaxID=36100 RepID=UPI001EE535DC|nr:myb-related transcription factor, partner of profilin-like [Haliotis rubra]
MSQQSGDSNNPKKRARQTNFSPYELSIIADEVKLRSHVLFSFFSSTVTNHSKMKEWDAIASKLNANSTVPRSSLQVRKKWNDYR